MDALKNVCRHKTRFTFSTYFTMCCQALSIRFGGPYQESDARDLFDAISESRAHLRPWLPFADKHQSIEETRDWINSTRAQWILRENFHLSILEKESRRFLGGTGLHPRDWNIGHFEIGYWLRASAEGHGYLTAALHLLVSYAFTSLEAQRLQIRCDE